MIKRLLLLDLPSEVAVMEPALKAASGVFETDACTSVDEAEKLFKENQYGLVVMNVELVEKTAVSFLEQIRRSNFVGQILFTAHFQNSEALKTVKIFPELKAVMKPFDMNWFKQTLTNYFLKGLSIGNNADVLDPVFILKVLNLCHCAVSVTIDMGDDTGHLFLDDGDIVNAKYKDLKGLDAAVEILAADHGDMTFSKSKRFVQKKIDAGMPKLLADAEVRRRFLKNSLHNELPPFISFLQTQLTPILGADAAAMTDRKMAEMGLTAADFPSLHEVDLVEKIADEINNQKQKIKFKKSMIQYLKEEGLKKMKQEVKD